MLLTTTHFHPEHAFAAQSFSDATYICNAAQAEEMAAKSGLTLCPMFLKGKPPGERFAALMFDWDNLPESWREEVGDAGGAAPGPPARGPRLPLVGGVDPSTADQRRPRLAPTGNRALPQAPPRSSASPLSYLGRRESSPGRPGGSQALLLGLAA